MYTFSKFSKITPAHHRTAKKLHEADGLWQVTEKVHGANVSFPMGRNGTIQVARRNDVLTEEELSKFHNVDQLLESLRPRLDALREAVWERYPDAESIQVYGELFGGDPPVQRELRYGERDFYLFDIAVDGHYLDPPEYQELAAQVGLTHEQPEFVGTWEECFEYSERTRATKSRFSDESREGNVLKPLKTTYVGRTRAIIKHKSDRFQESKVRTPKTVESDANIALLDEIILSITHQRLNNVLSHSVPDDMSDKRKWAGLLVADALEECEGLRQLNDKELKAFKKQHSATIFKIALDTVNESME